LGKTSILEQVQVWQGNLTLEDLVYLMAANCDRDAAVAFVKAWAFQEGDAGFDVDLIRALYDDLKVADPELAGEVAEQLGISPPGSITIKPHELKAMQAKLAYYLASDEVDSNNASALYEIVAGIYNRAGGPPRTLLTCPNCGAADVDAALAECLVCAHELTPDATAYCPACRREVKADPCNLTSLEDHGRCFDCQRRWQHGELEGEPKSQGRGPAVGGDDSRGHTGCPTSTTQRSARGGGEVSPPLDST
jgi:hypothetical protein